MSDDALTFDDAPVSFDSVPTDPTFKDRLKSLATGFNKGVLANIPGIPMDTALNVWDLAKAGAGYVGSKFGVKPEDLPTMTDRSQVPGSSSWIASQLPTDAVTPPTNDTLSNVLYNAGQGGAGAMLAGPSNLAQNMVAGAASNTLPMMTNDPVLKQYAAVLPAFFPGMKATAQSKIAALDQDATNNLPRTDIVNNLKDAGIVMSPSQANPSGSGLMVNTLESMAGKQALQQAAAAKNVDTVKSMVKDQLGITGPLDEAALDSARQKAWAPYAALDNAGPFVPNDPHFNGKINQIFGPYNQAVADFPNSAKNPQIEGLQSDMQQLQGSPTLLPGAITAQIKQLRSSGYANKNSDDPGTKDLGRTQLASSQALDDLLDGYLAQTGQQGLLTDMKAARQQIAKVYSADAATNPFTGEVNARNLYQQYNRGVPLTGALKTIAQAGGTVPKAVGTTANGAPVSKLDSTFAAAALVEALVTHNPAVALAGGLPILNSAVRKMMLTPGFQQRYVNPPDYAPSMLTRFKANLPAGTQGILGAMAADSGNP